MNQHNTKMSFSVNTDTIDSVAKEIFQMLTMDANKFRSVYSLYNEYVMEHRNTRVSKKDFSLVCELLKTYYKNIEKKYYNNICHVAFVTDSSLVSNNDTEQIRNLAKQELEDFNSLDRCDVIEYKINNPKYCSDLSLIELVDGTDTVLHLLARRNKYDLISKLSSLYDIDFDIRNKINESVLDVINYGDIQSATRIVKLITSYQINKYKLTNSISDDAIKKQNTTLVEQNNSLQKQIVTLTTDKKKLQSDNNSITAILCLMISLYLYFVFKYFI